MSGSPAAPDPEELAWPTHLLDVAEARAWISASLPDRPKVHGPVRVHWVRGGAVTARFAVHGARAVVFKATFLPTIVSRDPLIHALLFRHCPNQVPELLAGESWEGRAFMLFRPFAGREVGTLGRLEPVMHIEQRG